MQPILDEVYGKDTYKVEIRRVEEVQLDGGDKLSAYQEVYVLKKDTVLNEAMQDDLKDTGLYNKGPIDETDTEFHTHEHMFDENNMEKRSGKNHNFSTNIPLKDIEKIKDNLLWFLKSPALLEKLLSGSKHLLFRLRLFNKSKGTYGLHVGERGTIDFAAFSKYIENDVPIHEVVHELVYNLEKDSSDGINVEERNDLIETLIENIINSAWEDLNGSYDKTDVDGMGLSPGGHSVSNGKNGTQKRGDRPHIHIRTRLASADEN